jgi:2-oxoglutarate/2-oxoacid ferredoxin oxidoreductase subunit alpha
MNENELTILIGGEAGMGVESTGAAFALGLVRGGLHIFGVPDYRSRIRGGHNFFTIRISRDPLVSPGDTLHLVLALDGETVRRHADNIIPGGAVIYDDKEDIPDEWRRRSDIGFFPMPLTELAREKGGKDLMRNTLAIGAAAGLLGFDLSFLEKLIRDNFAAKGQDIVDGNLRVVEAGYTAVRPFQDDFKFRMEAVPDAPQRLMLNGSEAFGMGALAGGCRFVAGYPMTPGSPVLEWFAARGTEYGVVTKHAEDEIAAINMGIGAGYVGARALVPTSGGGFSLMVEGLGLAGMTETPVVVYNAQRPGPSTGLPTRTEQADLLFLIHASQGEFPRFVLAPGTLPEVFRAGWQSFNLAERFQTPVLVISDKFLATSVQTLEADAFDFGEITIDRGELLTESELDTLTERYKRYRVTESGISPRAVPGSHPNAVSMATSDEHDEYGAIDEEADNRIAQVDKRMRKEVPISTEMNGLTRLGPEKAELTLVCWGSTHGPLHEAVERLNEKQPGRVNMLHFSVMHPFPAAEAASALDRTRRIGVVEGNATGQLQTLLRAHTGRAADFSIRKYDGRPFSPDYIIERIPEDI